MDTKSVAATTAARKAPKVRVITPAERARRAALAKSFLARYGVEA